MGTLIKMTGNTRASTEVIGRNNGETQRFRGVKFENRIWMNVDLEKH